MEQLLEIFENNATIDGLVSMSITVVALVISLAILPFQRFSESISSNLYQLVIKNGKFNRLIIINLLLGFLQILLMIISPNSKMMQFLSATILILILLNAFFFYNKVRSQLDVLDICCPIIEKDLDKAISVLTSENIKLQQNPLFKRQSLQEMIIGSISSQDNPNRYPKGQILNVSFKVFIYKFQNIYEVIHASLDRSQYSTFEKAVQCLYNSVEKYSNYINGYYIKTDNFFFDFVMKIEEIHTAIRSIRINNIYLDMFLSTLVRIQMLFLKPNLNSDFYIKSIFEFFIRNVLGSSKYITDDLNWILRMIPIFKKEYLLPDSFKLLLASLNNELIKIYNSNNDQLARSSINRTINELSFYLLTSSVFDQYEASIVESIMKIQSKLSAVSLLTPVLVYDDFTTHMLYNYQNDRTLGRAAMILLYNQKDGNNGVYQNLKNLDLIQKIIQILGFRYISGGSHVDGILEQIYKLTLDLYIITDRSVFQQLYYVNWSWNWTSKEMNSIINIYYLLVKIALRSLILNRYSHSAPAILYSILKTTFTFCRNNKINIAPIIKGLAPLFIKAVIANKKLNEKNRDLIIILVIRNVDKKYRNALRKRLINLKTLPLYKQGSQMDDYNADYFHPVPADYYRFILPLIYRSVNKCLKIKT